MKLRYQVRYYRNILTVLKRPSKPDAFGSSSELNNLVRNAAGRCAIENYRMAVIVDHNKGGKQVRILRRTSTSVTIQEVV